MSTKREFERAAIQAPLSCHELDDAGVPVRSVKGKLFDLSRGGMGMHLQGMVHEGREVIVIMRAGGGVKSFYGTIRHVDYTPGGHAVGLMFQPVPAGSDVARSISKLERQAASAAA